MERIKEALERARAERQGSAAVTPGMSPAVAVGGGMPTAIQYTRTRIFQPDPTVLRDNRIIAAAGSAPAKDAFRMLRTRVLQRLVDNGWNSFAVTSPTGDVGKSMTAANLAVSLAREVNHTVLLVDADLRKPTIHSLFGYEPQAGLSDYLARQTPVEDMLFNPSIERLVVLPGREQHENSSELLSSPAAAELVRELRARYPERIVIFDLPPVLAIDDALAFSPLVDSYLMVLGEGETEADDLEAALEVLKETPLLGTVFNKATGSGQGYYY